MLAFMIKVETGMPPLQFKERLKEMLVRLHLRMGVKGNMKQMIEEKTERVFLKISAQIVQLHQTENGRFSLVDSNNDWSRFVVRLELCGNREIIEVGSAKGDIVVNINVTTEAMQVSRVVRQIIPETDQATVQYYDDHVTDYALRTASADMTLPMERFLDLLPDNGHILDAGCGPGRDLKVFHDKGYQALGLDASPKMVAHVNQVLKLRAFVLPFQEIEFEEAFDGIWAPASLLHVPPEALPDVFERLWKALKPNGIFYFSFKCGVGVVKEGERTFTHMDARRLAPLIDKYTLLCQWTNDSQEGVSLNPCKWLNTIVRK